MKRKRTKKYIYICGHNKKTSLKNTNLTGLARGIREKENDGWSSVIGCLKL